MPSRELAPRSPFSQVDHSFSPCLHEASNFTRRFCDTFRCKRPCRHCQWHRRLGGPVACEVRHHSENCTDHKPIITSKILRQTNALLQAAGTNSYLQKWWHMNLLHRYKHGCPTVRSLCVPNGLNVLPSFRHFNLNRRPC